MFAKLSADALVFLCCLKMRSGKLIETLSDRYLIICVFKNAVRAGATVERVKSCLPMFFVVCILSKKDCVNVQREYGATGNYTPHGTVLR